MSVTRILCDKCQLPQCYCKCPKPQAASELAGSADTELMKARNIEQMKVIGYITTTAILMVYAAMLNGWALAKLWSWFIVGTFGLPALSIPAAIGLSMVVSYLTHQMSDKKNEDAYWKILVKGWVAATIKPIFALLFGAIVKLWL